MLLAHLHGFLAVLRAMIYLATVGEERDCPQQTVALQIVLAIVRRTGTVVKWSFCAFVYLLSCPCRAICRSGGARTALCSLQFASSPSQAAERQRAPRKTFRPHRESQALAAGPVLRTMHRTVLRQRKENNIYFPAYFSCNSFQKDTNRLQKVLCPLSLATHAQCSFLFGHPDLGSRGQARIVRAANSCGQCPLSLTPAAAAQSGNLSLPSPVWLCYFRSLSQQHNAKRHIYSGVAFLLFILFFYFFYFI